MARQNTQLESAGAEFLVLGNLLIEGIPAFKSYTNMKGYDLVAVNDRVKSTFTATKFQVKSTLAIKGGRFHHQQLRMRLCRYRSPQPGFQGWKNRSQPTGIFHSSRASCAGITQNRRLGKSELFKVP